MFFFPTMFFFFSLVLSLVLSLALASTLRAFCFAIFRIGEDFSCVKVVSTCGISLPLRRDDCPVAPGFVLPNGNERTTCGGTRGGEESRACFAALGRGKSRACFGIATRGRATPRCGGTTCCFAERTCFGGSTCFGGPVACKSTKGGFTSVVFRFCGPVGLESLSTRTCSRPCVSFFGLARSLPALLPKGRPNSDFFFRAKDQGQPDRGAVFVFFSYLERVVLLES